MQFDQIREIVADTPYIGADEGRELYDFVMRERPSLCLELGHAHGVSTCYLAAALQEIGGRLDSVDLTTAADRDPNAETLLARAGLSGIVSLHREINSYNWFLKKKIEAQSANGRCAPCYDFCFIDGAKNWTIDGFAFFLVDKLLNERGWILFDDFTWTFGKHEGRVESDGITKRSLGPDEIAEPHVRRIFELLVMQHPAYSNFELQSDWWAWAQKVPDGHRNLETAPRIGGRTLAGFDMRKALDDPASAFGTPEAVADHAALSPDQKAEILRRWEYDAAEADVAGEEGMPDGGDDLLRRILVCLDRVTGGFDAERAAPSKQHGLPRAAIKRD